MQVLTELFVEGGIRRALSIVLPQSFPYGEEVLQFLTASELNLSELEITGQVRPSAQRWPESI